MLRDLSFDGVKLEVRKKPNGLKTQSLSELYWPN